MNIEIKLLKDHQEAIPALAKIWYEVLGSSWIPDANPQKAEKNYADHINSDCLPLTLVAFDKDKPIGMCSLRDNDGIRADLAPWFGSLVIDQAYQRQGIGRMLINAAIDKAKAMGIKNLYLFILNHELESYYASLGWKRQSMENFRGIPVIMMEKIIH